MFGLFYSYGFAAVLRRNRWCHVKRRRCYRLFQGWLQTRRATTVVATLPFTRTIGIGFALALAPSAVRYGWTTSRFDSCEKKYVYVPTTFFFPFRLAILLTRSANAIVLGSVLRADQGNRAPRSLGTDLRSARINATASFAVLIVDVRLLPVRATNQIAFLPCLYARIFPVFLRTCVNFVVSWNKDIPIVVCVRIFSISTKGEEKIIINICEFIYSSL